MKIQILKTGQVIVTIPRAIARLMGLEKGSEVNFRLEKGQVIFYKKEVSE